MNRKLSIIMDLQFGSTGKGLLAGYLAKRDQPDTLVTAWAANAGHTFIDIGGTKYVHTMLANGVVSPNVKRVLIGPGSVLDLDNLYKELKQCSDLLYNQHGEKVAILVHEHAAVIEQRHRDEEAGPMTKIGSTKKGCGAAAIQRIRRNPDDLNTAGSGNYDDHPVFNDPAIACRVVTAHQYGMGLDMAEVIQVEGAQGHSLSMYHGFYPYTTSRDVSVAQVLADCAIPAGWLRHAKVIGTARTFPIRVANRHDEQGKQVGWSGPPYMDQRELTFEELGQETELTTVTKLPRRIFTFSALQIKEAIRQNSVDEVFLNFANYCRSQNELEDIVRKIIEAGAPVRYFGYGPTVADVVDMAEETVQIERRDEE